MNSILAKTLGKDKGSPHADQRCWLATHLKDVHSCAVEILRASGKQQLLAAGLEPDQWLERLKRVVLFSAALHDLGKLNNQFQAMINEPWPPGKNKQAIRHEWVTTLIVDVYWRDWLRPFLRDEKEWQLMRWCVSGHHPKYGRSAPPEVIDGPPLLVLDLDNTLLDPIVGWLASEFHLPGQPNRERKKIDLVDFSFDSEIEQLRERYWGAQDFFDDPAQTNDVWRKLSAIAKNCLIAADVAGSAIPFEEDEKCDFTWINDTLGQELDTSKVCKKIVKKRLNGKQLRPFQKRIGASRKRVTIALAGCGTGKTVAGYHWAEHHARNRRLFFCYPTTGTGTEGFRDYLADLELEQPAIVELMHSRRMIDFELLLNPSVDRNSQLARIESLSIWMNWIVACTVDSVLGVVQNNRRGMYSWPAIGQGAFVFDEVHSYDDRLFDALLHFLRQLNGLPVLIMTASLQESRMAAIKEICGEDLEVIRGDDKKTSDEDIEGLERYVFPGSFPNTKKEVSTLDEVVFERIHEEIKNGGRVLFVVNTVNRAIALCDPNDKTGGQLADLSPLIYHSRFKYVDRIKKHVDVVKAFQSKDEEGCIAVTTQVCEQSLDLAAYDEKTGKAFGVTLLVSELAPIPSLIQRCGRLNRAARKGDSAKPVFVIQPRGWDGKESTLPYSDEQLEQAREWLSKLSGKVSQRDLANAWKEFDEEEDVPRWDSAWFDYGPSNPVLELREGAPSMTVLMEDDVGGKPRLRSNDIKKVAITMPIRRDSDDWQLTDDGIRKFCNGIPVAKTGSIKYVEDDGVTLLGARWNA